MVSSFFIKYEHPRIAPFFCRAIERVFNKALIIKIVKYLFG